MALIVMSWLTPRRPTTSPDEPTAGSARIANQRVFPSVVDDAILVLEWLTAGHGSLHQRTHAIAIVGMHHAEVSSKGALEVERIDTVHAMQLVAPLHRIGADVPQPPTDVGQRLPFAETLLDLGQCGLRQARLGELLGDADGAAEPAGTIDNRRHGQRDRHGHAIFPLDLGEDPIYPLTCGDALLDGLQIGAKVGGRQRREGVAGDLRL